MSHAATNWAIQQRGLKPATKIVLWHLCDRHHSDNGCFPSQDTLANDCEMSRSAVNVHLDLLEQAGLIAREQRRQKGSQRQERTRYFFAFEPSFARSAPVRPCPETGHGDDAEAVSGKSAEPCPENVESRVQNPDSNPVREPQKEPVNERERERDDLDEKEDRPPASREAIRRSFNKWYKTYPNNASIPHTAEEAWFALSADERAACLDRTGDYIDWCGGPTKVSTYASVYLKGRMWERLPARPVATAPAETVRAFGKAGMAYRLWIMNQDEKPHPRPTVIVQQRLDEGGEAREHEIISRRLAYSWPRLGEMNRRIVEREQLRVSPVMAELGADFVATDLKGPVGEAWKRFFRTSRLPWLPIEPDYAYLPALDAGDDLDRAVAAAWWQFAERCKEHADAG